MKITRLEILKVPPCWVWLKIHTNEGTYGLGEPYLENHPEAVIAEVERLSEVLIGADPMRIESLWDDMYNGFWYYKGGPVTMSAISGIDQALWDLKGKTLGLPVYELLGGKVHDSLLMYSHLYGPNHFVEPGRPLSDQYAKVMSGPPVPGSLEVDDWRRAARELVSDQGYRFLKLHFKIGGKLDLSGARYRNRVVEIIEGVRDEIGPEPQLALDMSHLHPQVAIQVLRSIADQDIVFVEDAQPIERISAFARIAERAEIPLAAGQSWMGKWVFADALEAGLTVAQPDLCHAGGLTECKKIAGMAESHYAKIALHTPNSIVQLAASVQLQATCPNFLAQEQNPINASWRGDSVVYGAGYLKHPLELDETGSVVVPDRPGFGLELDEDGLAEIMKMPWRVGRG